MSPSYDACHIPVRLRWLHFETDMPRKRETDDVFSNLRSKLLWSPLALLESDHNRLIEQILKIRRLFQGWRTKSVSAWRPSDRRFVTCWLERQRHHMGSHFDAEERTIFPYILRNIPGLRQKLVRLRSEHDAIRRESRAVETQFRALNRPANRSVRARPFCRQASALLALMERHIRQEQRLIRSHLAQKII